MYLFADAHFFLHYKHPQELPWGEVSSCDPLVLIVGRTVQKEIEKHKFELRGHPQDRARDYAAKLAKIVIKRQPLCLREKKPQIELDFIPAWPADWAPPPELNLQWADDAVVADLLAFRHVNPNADLALLTGDPGLIARATAFGLQVISLAGRNWEVQPEKTAAEKEVEKLRRENEELKRAGPLIECGLLCENRAVADIQFEAVRYQPLEPSRRDQLLAELRGRHPRVTDFSEPPRVANAGEEWSAPSLAEIDKYNRQYDAWVEDFSRFGRQAPDDASDKALSLDVHLVLQNDGNQPAEGVRLTIESLGGFLLYELDNADEDTEPKPAIPPQAVVPEKFRSPPPPPKWTRIIKLPPKSPLLTSAMIGNELIGTHNLASRNLVSGILGTSDLARIAQMQTGLDALRTLGAAGSPRGAISEGYVHAEPLIVPKFMPPAPRNKHAFYWRETPERSGVVRWEFECDEFQHRMDPENFEIRLISRS